MSEYYLVDVKSITSTIPRSQFREDDLDKLAQSILASGGLLSPILLKQTGLENYEVLAGDLEYYAAVKAKEINPRAAEMVNAFIISPKQQEAAMKQVFTLSKLKSSEATVQQSSVTSTSISDLRLTNLESRLDAAIQEIKKSQHQEIRRLDEEIKGIKGLVPSKIEVLETFNDSSPVELAKKLVFANIRGKTAESIVNSISQEREKAKFVSLSDAVKRIKGLGDKRMINIIDAWRGLN